MWTASELSIGVELSCQAAAAEAFAVGYVCELSKYCGVEVYDEVLKRHQARHCTSLSTFVSSTRLIPTRVATVEKYTPWARAVKLGAVYEQIVVHQQVTAAGLGLT